MLAILTTHPIQYHVPLWQMLAREGSLPFEVWYLSEHATKMSRDRQFGQDFAWDLDMLEGYPHRFLKTPEGATPNTPFRSRIAESLPNLFRETKTTVLWVQGWGAAAYWQAVWAAKKAGVEVWLRGESNAMREAQTTRQQDNKTTRPGSVVSGQWSGGPKNWAKRILLGQLFTRVDHFLCIGTANRELYRSYGVPESKLHMTPYAVDNDRFAAQARQLEDRRRKIREEWGIPDDAFCVLFCGKFIAKKRPMDLIKAAQLLLETHPEVKAHLLFVGSGELGGEMRAACSVMFDAEAPNSELLSTISENPPASFAGFLNQTEISKAYVAADVLVLPSDFGETWGLVVNEAMASGLPCIMSDRCGCAPDLGIISGNTIFEFGDIDHFARRISDASSARERRAVSEPPSLSATIVQVARLYGRPGDNKN